MNIQKCMQCFIIASLAVLAASFARADDAEAALGLGAIRGVALDGSGQPLAKVSVAIRSWDGSIDRMAISDSSGVFMADRLKPGPYRITASKEGLASAPVTTVEVAQNQITRPYVVLAAATPAAAAAPAAPLTMEQELQAMKDRIAVLEAELKARQATAAAPAAPASPAPAPPAAITAAAVPPAVQTPSDPKPQVGGKAPTPAAPPQLAPTQRVPEALEAPEPAPAVDNFTPFAFANFTWLNGTPRNVDTVLDTKFFTPEVRFDTNYMEDFNQPLDHTIVGATESFRSGEVQVEQISVGGDFHWQNVRGRVLTMFGMFATTTPRNDASFGVGQWDLRGAYKYTSEAYGGYHFNVNHGLNVDAGIFVSYIGLFSYYNFDNWTYQPSYVSSNTPWFFNGVRVQWFPTNKLKIEPWFINGWQSYAKYNGHPGLGGQLLWMPKEWFKLVANQYGYGQDNLGLPHTERIHTDDSIEVRYYHNPESLHISNMAFSLTGDAGCQYGGGLQCTGAPSKNKESFVGWMLYDRIWFHKDLYAFTLGGGEMSNWGRYLTLLPPINGADAVTGSPYFPEAPGLRAHMWDSTVTFQYMPREYITWWTEVGYRHSDIPYFAGRGGVTPPGFPFGGTNGAPAQYACMSGAPSGATDLPTATTNCASAGGVWFPDLRRSETKLSFGVMVKF
jgi:Putative beta-barrel porin-2, OmpL-like. bbp2/Carboxypeptidase regulatory-like domain